MEAADREDTMNNIYLIGFMGTGKTTVAKALAQKLNMDLMEMDDAIEAREGMDIPRIFQQRGEAWFRKVETDVLQEAAVRGNTVVSCGGGVPLKPENVAVMQKSGTVIMLSASPGEVYERVKESDRPLLKGNMNTDYIAGLMEKREGCYKAAADKEVETGRREISEIIQEIVQFCLQK